MLVYKLDNPMSVGSLTAPVNLQFLSVTGAVFSTKPPIAPIGTAQLVVTLTDPVSGWQTSIEYLDASVLAFFSQPAPAIPSGATMQEVMEQALFAKLIADGKLPPGTLTTN